MKFEVTPLRHSKFVNRCSAFKKDLIIELPPAVKLSNIEQGMMIFDILNSVFGVQIEIKIKYRISIKE
ncbi:MAG: hypothetical protein A2338_01970 [Bacteroidetes bacterium RIFOXYB12_FULL_41_6]|nr:MAG: hypothetical protein A2338_01970 [Bacteroidetes bacterium RIFOXYB12_FULL_41_6]